MHVNRSLICMHLHTYISSMGWRGSLTVPALWDFRTVEYLGCSMNSSVCNDSVKSLPRKQNHKEPPPPGPIRILCKCWISWTSLRELMLQEGAIWTTGRSVRLCGPKKQRGCGEGLDLCVQKSLKMESKSMWLVQMSTGLSYWVENPWSGETFPHLSSSELPSPHVKQADFLPTTQTVKQNTK